MSETGPKYIRLQGSAFEIGHQHGSACGSEIRDYVDWLLAEVNRRPVNPQGGGYEQTPGSQGPIDIEELRDLAMTFAPYYEEYAPHLLEEIRGIADGAQVDFADALLVNVRGEIAGLTVSEGCTSFAISPVPTSPRFGALVGQNLDMHKSLEALLTVVHITPDDRPQVLMLSFGGLVGYHGINELGVAHGANSLSAGNWQMGLPHYPFKRLILEQEDVSGCLKLAERVKLTSGGNYFLADGNGDIADLEIVPEEDGVHRIECGSEVITHGNHFRHPDLVARDHLLAEFPESPARQDRMESIIKTDYGSVDPILLQQGLADHSLGATGICRHGDPLKTIGSFVADAGNRKLYACQGNPCVSKYMEYSFS